MGYGTATGVNTTNAYNAPAAESSSPIRDAISGGEQLLSDLQVTIDMLEKRLDTVTTPSPPIGTDATRGNVAGPVVSHMRGRLGIMNEGYQHAIVRLRNLIDRIDV